MKALVLKKYNEFNYEDVPAPECGANDVMIEVKACGICGSDVHGMDGSTGRRQPPLIMGHEAAGIVCEIGENVKNWKIGDRVTFDSTVYCGTCAFCRSARINLCDNRRVLGVSCDDYRQHGAFAEYVVVPQHIVYHVPNEVSFAQAAMVEALSIAVHGVARTSLKLGDNALVVGTGMIGLLVVQTLKQAGCGQIIAVDLDQEKLEMAMKFGADIAIDATNPELIEQIQEATNGLGADVALEVVGLTPTVSTAINALRKGGELTLVGNLSPSIEIPLQSVVTREIRVNGSCASNGEYPVCLDLIKRGKADVDTLISACAPLKDGAEWFQRLYDKEKGLMKVILEP